MIDFTDFDANNVPATVVYSVRGRKRAIVYHPAGPGHENAALTAMRLRKSGFSVIVAEETFRQVTPPVPALEGISPPWKASRK